MKLNDIEINRILPDFMQDDPTIKAINAVIEPELKNLTKEMARLPLFSDLEALTEAELDLLAAELDIPWYNKDFSKSKKVDIVRRARKMIKKLGTPAVFSEVLEMIFGGVQLEEAGIDYDGAPFHFRVAIKNGESLSGVNFERFMYLLKKIKRASCWLDDTYAIYNADGNVYHDIICEQLTHETIKFDSNLY